MNKARWWSAALILTTMVVFFALDLGDYLTLDYFHSQHARIQAYYAERPVVTILAFLLLYIATAGLSLPGSSLLPLFAGVIFGLFWGTVWVSVASIIAATLEFLAARHFLRDAILSRFAYNVLTLKAGVENAGAYYLFALRLVPFAPFLVVNLVMGLTTIKTPIYIAVSLIGILISTAVYVNVGTELGHIKSWRGLLSPGLLVSLAILGLLPLAAKKLIRLIHRHREARKMRETGAV